MSLSTAAAIRDRIIALIESLTPTVLVSDRFRRHRNEQGDFRAWAEANPVAALRRFQVREVGDDEPPETSSVTEERVRVQFEVVIAYPQTNRTGPANALDRDDAMNADWLKINYAVGVYGRASFGGANDCTPLGAVKSREDGEKVDYLAIRAEYLYQRTTT